MIGNERSNTIITATVIRVKFKNVIIKNPVSYINQHLKLLTLAFEDFLGLDLNFKSEK